MSRHRRAHRLSRAVDVVLDATIVVLLTTVTAIVGATLVLAGPLVPGPGAACPVPDVPDAGCTCHEVVR